MNLYNAYKITEKFGNTTDYTKTTSFESNTSVKSDLIVSSINNIVNNGKNDVLQNNIAAVSLLASATNEFKLMNNSAKVISVTGVRMENEANATVTGDTKQSAISTVSESFSNSFNNQINNEVNDNYNTNKNN
jgi:hypothetical protein